MTKYLEIAGSSAPLQEKSTKQKKIKPKTITFRIPEDLYQQVQDNPYEITASEFIRLAIRKLLKEIEHNERRKTESSY